VGFGGRPTTAEFKSQQIMSNVRPVVSCGGTIMTPALIVERQRFLAREVYRERAQSERAQFAPVKGIIAASLLSALLFWLPLFVVISLYRS
jgi:hypothetical protein